MYAYGDESGHLRNLLSGYSDVFVLGVVAGGRYDCGACPKQAVRRVTDLDEAKWRDLSDVQKRRVVECLADGERDLSCAYIVLCRSDLASLDRSYLIHQNRAFDVEWDLGVIGYGYAYLLEGMTDRTPDSFTFDRLFGHPQSDAVRETIRRVGPDMEIQHHTSHGTRGIQAADCLAGLVAETHRGGENWVNELNERITDLSAGFVESLAQELRNTE